MALPNLLMFISMMFVQLLVDQSHDLSLGVSGHLEGFLSQTNNDESAHPELSRGISGHLEGFLSHTNNEPLIQPKMDPVSPGMDVFKFCVLALCL